MNVYPICPCINIRISVVSESAPALNVNSDNQNRPHCNKAVSHKNEDGRPVLISGTPSVP